VTGTAWRDIKPKRRKLSNKHIADKNALSLRNIEVFTTETVQPAKSIPELECFLVRVCLQDTFLNIAFPLQVK